MSLFLNTREKRLIQAIEDNNINYVSHLLSSKKSLNINYKSKNNFTPLLLAASLSGREEIIKIILNAENINLNLKTKDNETALHLAIPNYNLEIIQLLIKNNINLNERDKFGKTAIVKIIEQIKRYTIPNEVLNDSIINFATASSVYSDDTITSISIDGNSEQNSGSDKSNEEKVIAKLKKRKELKDENSSFDEISLSSDFSWIDNNDSGSLELCENYIESLSMSLKQRDINEVTNTILNNESIEDNRNAIVNLHKGQNLNENLMINTNMNENENSIVKESIKEDNIESAKTIANEIENDLDDKLKYNYEIQNKQFLKDSYHMKLNYNNNNNNLFKEIRTYEINDALTNNKEIKMTAMNIEINSNNDNDYLVKQHNYNNTSDLTTPVIKEGIIEDQNIHRNEDEQPQLTEEATESRPNHPTSIANTSTDSTTIHNFENTVKEVEVESYKLSDSKGLESSKSLESLDSLTINSSFTNDVNKSDNSNNDSLNSNEERHNDEINKDNSINSDDANREKYNGDKTPQVLRNSKKNNSLKRPNHYNTTEKNNTINANTTVTTTSATATTTTTTTTFTNNNNNKNDNNNRNNNSLLEKSPSINHDMSLQECQLKIKEIKLSDNEEDEEQEENDTSSNSINSTSASEFSYLPSEIKAKKQDFYKRDFCSKSNINLNFTDNNSFVESIIPYENVSVDSIFIKRKPSKGFSLTEKRNVRNRYSSYALSTYDKLRFNQTSPSEKNKRKMSKTLINESIQHHGSISDTTNQSSILENEIPRETNRQRAKKYLAMLELLLWNDADPNVQDIEGRTSLIIACIFKLRQVVPVLLQYGTSVNTRDYLGKTALMYSCEKQEDGIVKQLLDYHSNINLQDKNGLTALMLACKYDNEEIIRLLLENRARVNRQDKNGDTALTFASRYGCTKAVYHLMRYCANGNIKNKRGETALIIACRHVNVNIIHILVNQPIDIDLQDRNGNTALIYICQKKYEYTEIVREFLLKHNVNINIKNKAGNSALHIAVFNNHLEIVKLLLLNHADINIKNSEGNTVLMMASSSANREKMVQLLLNFSNYYVSPRNIIKVLQLRKKRKLKYEKLEELLLLNTYVDVNAVNNEGDSALIIAARNGNPRIVRDLLRYHADCNLQNARLETAIIKAIKSMNKCISKIPIEKYQQIIKLLLLNNADTHIKDYKKHDFIYYAKSNKMFMQVMPSLSKQKSTPSKSSHQLQHYRN
jgi:ankyrin repeat protein